MKAQLDGREARWNSHGHVCKMCKESVPYPKNQKVLIKKIKNFVFTHGWVEYCDDCIGKSILGFLALMIIMKRAERYPSREIRNMIFTALCMSLAKI
jgi:hypothetical protein